jgi:hypothetical protein
MLIIKIKLSNWAQSSNSGNLPHLKHSPFYTSFHFFLKVEFIIITLKILESRNNRNKHNLRNKQSNCEEIFFWKFSFFVMKYIKAKWINNFESFYFFGFKKTFFFYVYFLTTFVLYCYVCAHTIIHMEYWMKNKPFLL